MSLYIQVSVALSPLQRSFFLKQMKTTDFTTDRSTTGENVEDK